MPPRTPGPDTQRRRKSEHSARDETSHPAPRCPPEGHHSSSWTRGLWARPGQKGRRPPLHSSSSARAPSPGGLGNPEGAGRVRAHLGPRHLCRPGSRAPALRRRPNGIRARSRASRASCTRAHFSARSRVPKLCPGTGPPPRCWPSGAQLAAEGERCEPSSRSTASALTRVLYGHLPGPPLPLPPPARSRCPRTPPGPQRSPGRPCPGVRSQATPQVSRDLASALCPSMSQKVFRDPAGPALRPGAPHLNLPAGPPAEGAAVSPQSTGVLPRRVRRGHTRPLCAAAAGCHPAATLSRQEGPRCLPRTEGVEGPRGEQRRDGPAGGRPRTHRAARGSEKGP